VTAPTYNETAPAARYVKRIAWDEDDERMLLDLLGLVGPDGEIVPDDTTVYVFKTDHAGKSPGARTPKERDRSAVPEGLATLTPTEEQDKPSRKRPGPKPQPKVIRPKKPREIPPCGTHKAFSRHKRRGEPVDDACLEAGRAYSRDYQNSRNARIKKETEMKRLTDAGVNEETARVLSELAR